MPHYTAIVTLLVVLLYFFIALRVAAAHGKFNVKLPAMIGNPDFERVYRVQVNTLEWAPIFLPLLWLCANLFQRHCGRGGRADLDRRPDSLLPGLHRSRGEARAGVLRPVVGVRPAAARGGGRHRDAPVGGLRRRARRLTPTSAERCARPRRCAVPAASRSSPSRRSAGR